MKRYTLILSTLLLLVAVVAGECDRTTQTIPPEDVAPIVLTSGPGELPDWAQTQPATRSTPPPEAAGPGLPGTPSMPIPGIAFLVLGAGVLAWRRLQSS